MQPMKPLTERPTAKQVYFDWLREHSTKPGAMSRQRLENEFFTSFMGKAILGAEQLQRALDEGAAGSASRPNYPKKVIDKLEWRPTAEDYK